MIKNFPFYDYATNDGLSIDDAMYYSDVATSNSSSTSSSYINNKYFSNQKKTQYFLINFKRNTQYTITLQKNPCGEYYYHYVTKIKIYKYSDKELVAQLDLYDQSPMAMGYSAYSNIGLKIIDGALTVWQKLDDLYGYQNIVVSKEDTIISDSEKFYVSFQPNFSQITITPRLNNFSNRYKVFSKSNNYYRQQNIFIQKYSDTQSSNLNKISFPTDNLVFYFDFQDYTTVYNNQNQLGLWCNTQNYLSKYGNYELSLVCYDMSDMSQIPLTYAKKQYQDIGIAAKLQNSAYVMKSNFLLDTQLQQFTIMFYIKRNQNFVGNGYYQPTKQFYDLLSYGYYGVDDREINNEPFVVSQYQDEDNKDKGFGLFITNNNQSENNCSYLNIRINNSKFYTEYNLTQNQWYHIAVTYKKQSEQNFYILTYYVNGEKQNQQTTNIKPTKATKFYLGSSRDFSYYNNTFDYDEYYGSTYYGYANFVYGFSVDQVALFNVGLDDVYIKTIYNNKVVL